MGRPKKKITVRPSRMTNNILVAVFVAFLSVFFVLICLLPKHEGELSPNERRVLVTAPHASVDNILGGGFSEEVDAWLEDHFPARTFFVSVYSYINRLTGRNAVESIILGKNDRLFPAPVEIDEATVADNGSMVSEFILANGLNAYTAIIPSSGYMLKDELPALHLEYRDDEIVDLFEGGCGAHSTPIDLESFFKEQDDVGSLYYRTDHHLTMRGSYLLYTKIAETLGFTPVSESEFTKTSYDFYGTSYGGSGLYLTKPDALETWLLPQDPAIEVTTIDGSIVTDHSGTVDHACLKDGVVDKYAAYLYSNHGYTSIVNPNVESGVLLVLKDSYGNAIVPFLTSHYHEIIMLDVRYFSSSMELPSETVERLGITDMLVVYGIDSAATLRELAWLR